MANMYILQAPPIIPIRFYHTLTVENLNNLIRSYNLLAPELAKKPYFSLERELNACYLDVAPQLANSSRKAKEVPSSSVGGSGGQVAGCEFMISRSHHMILKSF
ncbi:hypothetical protein BGX38DRAFT_1227045 [Terfezia claveryi]|nr:hypothetical protein BGX38DRAFT_1227045 [Terfezia claveryi]